MTISGCSFCHMDTAGNHESDCPMNWSNSWIYPQEQAGNTWQGYSTYCCYRMNYCSNCGRKTKNEEKYCPECGTYLYFYNHEWIPYYPQPIYPNSPIWIWYEWQTNDTSNLSSSTSY